MPFFIIATLVAYQALLVLVHLATYATLGAAFGVSSVYLEWLFIVLAPTFVAASILARWYKAPIVRWFYAFSAYWFGLVHFLFAGGFAFFLIENILNAGNIYVSPALIGGICFATGFLIHTYGTWNSWRAEVTRVTVTLPDLPDVWRGKSIVFFSDPHLGDVRAGRFMAKIVRRIKGLNAEAVLIGGDIYDGVACHLDRVIAPLKELHLPRGVFFVSGNHEYYLPNPEEAFRVIKDTGVTILNNEVVDLGGITLIGLDYHSSNTPEAFEKNLDLVRGKKGQPVILLKHEPRDLEIAERAGVSLGLFGHTHRGQIWPLSYFTRQIYKGFDYGLKSHGTMQVCTSSGVGTWGPPIRLGTRSEIVLITFA